MRHCRHPVAVALTAVKLARDAFVAKQSPEHARSMAGALTGFATLLGSFPNKDSQAQALTGATDEGQA